MASDPDPRSRAFRRTHGPAAARRREVVIRNERVQVYARGLIAGLVGYATVAIVMAVVNVLLGRSPFHTAALLGSTIFYGLADPSRLTVWAGPVLAYNGVHLLLFLAVGVVAAWFAHLAERGPHFWYLGAIPLLFVALHLFGAFLFLDERIRVVLSPWMVLAAGGAAMVAMSVYLVATHPKLRAEMGDFAALDADLAAPHK